MWHLKTLGKVEVVVQVFSFFFCSGLRVSVCMCMLFITVHAKSSKWETIWLECKDVLTRTHILQMPSRGCPHLPAYIFMRSNWYFGLRDLHQQEDILRQWQICTCPRSCTLGHTDIHSCPYTKVHQKKKRKGKKGAGPRASFGPRRSTVWQICLTLHFLHNSLYFGPKWPAWSPWISMSRMSVWVSSVCFDACRRLCRFKSSAGLEEEGEAAAGYCWQRHLCHLKNCNVYVTLRNVTEIGAPLSILSNFVTVPLPGKKLNKESSFWPLSDQRRSYVLAASPLTFTNKPEWKIRF